MKKTMFKKGFKAVKEEEKRQEKLREERKGKLWRVFFPKDADEDYEIPIRFLTNEPLCFYEHSVNVNGKVSNYTCTGEDCPHCASGNKPRFVGAFLVVDLTEREVDEKDKSGNKTGKKKLITSTLKLLVRGQTDLSQLDRLERKYGLLDREWSISKTGSGTSTKWSFDRGEIDELTEEEIEEFIPDSLRDKDFDDIVIDNVQPSEDDEVPEDDKDSDEDIRNKVNRSLHRVSDDDDNEEDERPSRAPRNKRSTKVGKSSSRSTRSTRIKRK